MSTRLKPNSNPLASKNSPQGLWLGETRLTTVTMVISILVVFNAVGLLLVVRRFVGALTAEMSWNTMLLTAVVTTALAACARIAWRRQFPLAINDSEEYPHVWQHRWDRVVGYGTSLSLVLLAIGCCYPANHTSDWLIWLPLLVVDQLWRQSFFDAGNPEREIRETDFDLENELLLASITPATHRPTLAFNESGPPPALDADFADEFNEEIVQQLYRVRDELGQEVIYGTLRADFLAGQRTAVIHAGFCPPLTHLPEIEAESFRGPAARIKIVQAMAHGTRMDVRLTAPAPADCHVWIDMAATPATPQEKIAS